MTGEAAPVFLPPAEFVRSPESLHRTWSPSQALAYTRWLATHHYENFHIVTLFLPKRLHQDFYNVYSYCRWADDLGDEIGDTAESLRLLVWWREGLDAMYRGSATHPVFVALQPTVQRYGIPRQPFSDLIDAFVQDQTVTRYRDWDALFDYCRCSANPVGRLVLYLCGYSDAARQSLSDATCTALQLANFWQDVKVDFAKDRVYIPQDEMQPFGVSDATIEKGIATPEFRALLKYEVEFARDLFRQGLPLIGMVDRDLAVDLDLFSRGGLEILNAIAHRDYDVLSARPSISKRTKLQLALRAVSGKFLPFLRLGSRSRGKAA
jgi:squalene synthase HpnC